MPIVLGLHALLTALVLPWLLPHLPGGPPLHFHALARCRPATNGLALARVAFSGLVGGLSHVFLDGFTHGGDSGWALPDRARLVMDRVRVEVGVSLEA